ncbi:MAG: DinB family protein [Pseudonocardia sp.]
MNGDRGFEGIDMTHARFRNLDMTGARFEGVNLSGTVMRGVELVDVDIDGELRNVTINGVAVAPLVEAELDRRFPDRAKMRPRDPDGFREAWTIVERLWAGTVAKASALDPELLHESVDGEWSFIQTLRHLVFATDAWINRVILGDPHPWDPLDLPFDQMRDRPGILRDRDARPSLDQVVRLRTGRMATARAVIDRLTVEQLDSRTEPVLAPGWPEPRSYPVRGCLLCILNEEWRHRLFAERDLDALAAEQRPRSGSDIPDVDREDA